jgi:dihydrofolate synthase/folylpolyglutamate synthase
MERCPESPRILVFAAKSDKDIAGMLTVLLPITDHLIVTQAIDSRAEAPDNIAELVREQGYQGPVEVIPAVPQALQMAEALAGNVGLVVVTGSLFLVGEARSVYGLPVGQVLRWKVETV